MNDWRLFASWSDAELAPLLEEAALLGENVGAPDGQLTPERGWNHVLSHATLGREPPGPPLPDGAFARARSLIERFAFSDPRIVVGHFRGDDLLHRTVLLELKAFAALHLLCPVRVGAVRDETGDGETRFGYRFDTLRGHVERGREWFLLVKDHATGEVRFRIEAGFRVGDFPGWWARFGFRLVGRRYQRAWHRLAHEHLRAALRSWRGRDRRAHGQAAEHSGAVEAPVQFVAQKAQKPIQVEEEAEHMRRDKWMTVAALGLLSGVRSFLPPALLSLEKKHRSGLSAQPDKVAFIARAAQALAVAELLADKVARVPSRTHPVSLLARAASGALVGFAVSPRAHERGALLGAGAAVAGTFLAVGLRRFATGTLRVPNALAGALEDVLTTAAGTRLASALP